MRRQTLRLETLAPALSAAGVACGDQCGRKGCLGPCKAPRAEFEARGTLFGTTKQIALAEWLRALFAHVAGGHIGEGGARENIDRIDRRTRMMTANRAPFEVGKPSRLLPIEVGHSIEAEDRKSTRLNSSHYCAPRMP